MKVTADGRIVYAVSFQDGPWLDADFVVDRQYTLDEQIPLDVNDERTWVVADFHPAPEGEPDLLVVWAP
jgi:hypothetical protein